MCWCSVLGHTVHVHTFELVHQRLILRRETFGATHGRWRPRIDASRAHNTVTSAIGSGIHLETTASVCDMQPANANTTMSASLRMLTFGGGDPSIFGTHQCNRSLSQGRYMTMGWIGLAAGRCRLRSQGLPSATMHGARLVNTSYVPQYTSPPRTHVLLLCGGVQDVRNPLWRAAGHAVLTHTMLSCALHSGRRRTYGAMLRTHQARCAVPRRFTALALADPHGEPVRLPLSSTPTAAAPSPRAVAVLRPLDPAWGSPVAALHACGPSALGRAVGCCATRTRATVCGTARPFGTFVSQHYRLDEAAMKGYLERKKLVYKVGPPQRAVCQTTRCGSTQDWAHTVVCVSQTTDSHFVVKECPLCPKPTYGRADNQWKLYIKRGDGAHYCHRCGSKGSWFDLKRKLGDISGDLKAASSPTTASQYAPGTGVHDAHVAAVHTQALLDEGKFPNMLKYLTQTRGISEDVLRMCVFQAVRLLFVHVSSLTDNVCVSAPSGTWWAAPCTSSRWQATDRSSQSPPSCFLGLRCCRRAETSRCIA